MKVPFSWLKQYVDIDVTAQELEDKLFGCGFEVEELIDLGGEISKVVVGVVTECVPQEGTHLHICKVDCGEYGHDIQISTGASNVYEGMHYRFLRGGYASPSRVFIRLADGCRHVDLGDTVFGRIQNVRPRDARTSVEHQGDTCLLTDTIQMRNVQTGLDLGQPPDRRRDCPVNVPDGDGKPVDAGFANKARRFFRIGEPLARRK